ncbi:MAG: hypothetical protein ACI8WB_005753 [Phenylobacterium sp.]|jgi:hypothetical protein
MQIHVLELRKWAKQTHSLPQHRWLYFFNDSKRWLLLPENLNTPIMRQAMNVLEQISDKEDDYYRYLAIEDAMIEKATIARQKEDADIALRQAKVETQQLKVEAQQLKIQVQRQEAKAQEQQTRAELVDKENEHLKRLLREAGINAKK